MFGKCFLALPPAAGGPYLFVIGITVQHIMPSGQLRPHTLTEGAKVEAGIDLSATGWGRSRNHGRVIAPLHEPRCVDYGIHPSNKFLMKCRVAARPMRPHESDSGMLLGQTAVQFSIAALLNTSFGGRGVQSLARIETTGWMRIQQHHLIHSMSPDKGSVKGGVLPCLELRFRFAFCLLNLHQVVLRTRFQRQATANSCIHLAGTPAAALAETVEAPALGCSSHPR